MLHHNYDTQWPPLEGPALDEPRMDVWGFIQRRKSFVIAFAIIGSGLGYLLFQQKIPQYRSIAQVEIIHRVNESIFQGLLGKDMLADAMFVIRSPDVLRPAFSNHKLSRLETLRGLDENQAVGVIGSGLRITQLSLGVIEIQFTGRHSQDATRITNAVADEYIQRQTLSFESEAEKLTKILENDRENIRDQLSIAEKEHEEFIKKARLLATQDTKQSLGRLSALSAKISLLDIEEAELTSRLSLFNDNLGEVGQRASLLVLIGKEHEAAQRVNPVDAVRQSRIESELRMSQALLPLVVDAAVLEQKVGAGHPRLLEVRRRIELVRLEYAKMESMISEPEPGPLDVEPKISPDYLVVYRQALTHELDQLRAQRSDLRELLETAEQQAYLISKDEQAELRLRRKIDRLEEQYSSIAGRIGQTELSAETDGVRAKVIMPATTGLLVSPILYRFLGFGSFIGALVGMAFAFVVELADQSFRKPNEVVREFGVPILGHVPYMQMEGAGRIPKPEDDKLAPILVCSHTPRSRAAEAFRSVRTAVCFTASGDSHRVLQVTSPAVGDGKSTLAANLAISLAQSGKKTILIESDFRRPCVHRLTGVSNDVGIVEVLRGQAELVDAIQPLKIDGLSVLPCGKRPGNPSELITRPEYGELLEVLRQKFEYLIVDTPPVLVVTDSSSVAPRVDGVIMCIRLSRHTRDLGRRTMGQIRDVGAHIVGMVINGVVESDAYGFTSYNYSDYRASDYARGDSHDSYVNGAYFMENEEQEVGSALVKSLIANDDDSGSVKRPGEQGDEDV